MYIMAQHIIEDFVPYAYKNGASKKEFINKRTRDFCSREFEDEAFVVVDIGDVLNKHKEWLRELPRVTPFYAVKCMPYTPLLSVLASLGCGFDCASLGEINRVLSLGVSPSRIVYSHCWKRKSYLSYALKNHVDLTTFDDEAELLKIKEVFPEARLLLRLTIVDESANTAVGLKHVKYGCHQVDVKSTLEFAKKHELHVVGVHYHLGSESDNPEIFESAIGVARKVFDIGNDLGFNMNVLDIGGGFPGSRRNRKPFRLYARSVNEGIRKYFPADSGVTIIAEPGRFYVESAATLLTAVIGIRTGRNSRSPDVETQSSTESNATQHHSGHSQSTSEPSSLPTIHNPLHYEYMYFVNDSLFTSFMKNLFGFRLLPPSALKEVHNEEPKYESVVAGETCAEKDFIVDRCMLPKLQVDDWVVFEDMGAYTNMVTGFNGFKRQFFYYAVPENVWKHVQPLLARCTKEMNPSNKVHTNEKDKCDQFATEVLQDVYSLK